MSMDEKTIDGIRPYRMTAITKTVADVTERIVSGKYLYNPTYHECEIVIELVAEAIHKCKDKEDKNVY